MNKKQIIGLVAAALIFTGVGVSSTITNSIAANLSKANEEAAAITSQLSGVSLPSQSYVGVVNVEGTIQSSSSSDSIFGTTATYNHAQTLKYIDDMKNDRNNKGIILYVDSPGGGVYESDELYLKLEEYKQETGRKVWGYMASQACSGGYYISMATDEIYANRNTKTGSLGVIMSLTNVKDLYDKIGIKQIDITSGPNKSMGSQAQDLTDEQREIIQAMVDESYEQFVEIIADGRNMTTEEVKPLADGRIYTAKQALDLGLIDKIDTYENMQKEILSEIGINTLIYTPSKSENVLSSFFAKAESLKTKSDAQVITEYLEEKGTGGLMYYAK